MPDLLSNLPIAIILIAAICLGVVVFAGALISVLSNVLTGAIVLNAPAERAMNDWRARQLARERERLEKGSPSRLFGGDNPYPAILSALLALAAIAVIMITVVPRSKDCVLPKFEADPECIPFLRTVQEPLKLTRDARAASFYLAKVPAGDPARGRALFESQGCVACHGLARDEAKVGPSLYGIYTKAATRKADLGYNADQYLYESIVNPNGFVGADFQPNIMPTTFVKSMRKTDMADLLAWMRTSLNQTD